MRAGRPKKTDRPRDQVLVEAARRVFLDLGYGAASVDAIVREAGVSKATAYRHFRGKEELFRAVLTGVAEELREGLVLDEAASLEPEAYLTLVGGGVLAALRSDLSARLFRLVIEEANLEGVSASLFSTLTAPTIAQLAGYLDEQTRAGVLQVEDPELAALQFLGLLKEATFWARLLGIDAHLTRSRSDEEVLKSAVRVFLAAYRA